MKFATILALVFTVSAVNLNTLQAPKQRKRQDSNGDEPDNEGEDFHHG